MNHITVNVSSSIWEYSVLIRLLRELSSLYLDDGGYTEDIQSVF